MRFEKKTIVVTGASQGIGRATALRFASEGGTVVVCYLSHKTEAKALVEEIGAEKSWPIAFDLTDEEQVKDGIRRIGEKFGEVDVLVNNAGAITRPAGWGIDADKWRHMIDVNLTSAWLMTKYVVPLMRAGGSSIVNVGSVYGDLGSAPVLSYAVAKGGISTMTKAFAKELAPSIRVNAVAPSNVWTAMTRGADESLIERFRSQTPLGRIADPEEIASVVTFLASRDASYVTGQILAVDGGYSLK